MATGTFYATSSVSGTCLTPANAVGSTAATWTTNVNFSSWDHIWELAALPGGGATSGAQSLTIRARKDTGTSPTLDAYLLEDGVQTKQIVTAQTISSTTGQDVTVSWTPDDPTKRYRIRVVATAQNGGNNNTRSTVALDYIRWDAVYAGVESGASALTVQSNLTATAVPNVAMNMWLSGTANSFPGVSSMAYDLKDTVSGGGTVVLTCLASQTAEVSWAWKGAPGALFPTDGLLSTQMWLPSGTGGGTGWTCRWRLRRVNAAGAVQATVDQSTQWGDVANNNTLLNHNWTGLDTSLGTWAAGDALVVSFVAERSAASANDTLTLNVNNDTYCYAKGKHQGTGRLWFRGTETPLTVQSALTADGTVVPGIVVHDGAAALTVQSNATAAGTRVQAGASALTIQSAATAAGVKIIAAASALTIQSAVTAAGVTIDLGAAAWTAATELTAAGLYVAVGAASLTSETALTSAGVKVTSGQAALTADTTLTSDGTVVPLTPTVDGAADLTVQSALAASSLRATLAASALTSDAALVAAAVKVSWGASSLTVQSDATATVTWMQFPGATLTSQSDATAAVVRVQFADTTLTGSSTFTGVAVNVASGASALSVESALSGVGILAQDAAATFTVQSALAADGGIALGGTATLTVQSGLAAAAAPIYRLILPTRSTTRTRHVLHGRYSEAVGVALVLKDGVGKLKKYPSDFELTAADSYWLGGYNYQISSTERAAVVAAGFGGLIEEA